MTDTTWITHPPYFVMVSKSQVQAWSTKRLPFEPRGWQKEFRERLRSSVSQLHAQPQHVLHAIYASPVREFCDTENVLLYNVGPSHFASSAHHGLRFERAFSIDAPCPVPLSSRSLHYHNYFVASANAPLRHGRAVRPCARWSFTADPREIGHCERVWYQMKTSQIDASSCGDAVPDVYGVRATITAPTGSIRLASAVKPLLDGIISALHQHDGSDISEVSRRLAAKLDVQPRAVIALLQDDRSTVLGRRSLVHRFGASVQWNPQDDTCMAVELALEKGRDRPVRIEGELFSIVQR